MPEQDEALDVAKLRSLFTSIYKFKVSGMASACCTIWIDCYRDAMIFI